MPAGKAALEALMGMLPKAAARVDLGDMARPVTSARMQALESLVPKVDDWGWKGGKPGEITGSDYVNILDDASYNAQQTVDELGEGEDMYYAIVKSEMDEPRRKAMVQLQKSNNPQVRKSIGDALGIEFAMSDFARLEKADIPRKWTGKVYAAMSSSPSKFNLFLPDDVKNVSNIMRNMNNSQRETFVALLPDWNGSLDDLAQAAKTL